MFGTGAPFCDAGTAVAALSYADITQKEKEAIAGGNIEKLTGGINL